MFTNLVPGEYSVHIAQAGFKGYDQKSIMLSAQERIDLHDIKLSVGDVVPRSKFKRGGARSDGQLGRSVLINRRSSKPRRSGAGTIWEYSEVCPGWRPSHQRAAGI